MKDIARVEFEFSSEQLSARAERKNRLRLSPMVGRESREFLFEGLHGRPQAITRRTSPPAAKQVGSGEGWGTVP